MRDIFADIYTGKAADPMESARRGARPRLRARFYGGSQVVEGREGFAILLDGKPVLTPLRRTLAAPARALAEAIAAEWEAQREVIEPAKMPLTRLANSIIDGVADAPETVKAEIGKYLATDMLFYRADGPEGLIARQAQHWNPLLDWARQGLGAHFVSVEGVRYVPQPASAMANAMKAIPEDSWRLGTLHAFTTLTGSALIALALLRGRLSIEQAWAAAHVDEDWQVEQWGRDEHALEHRVFRFIEMQAAVRVLNVLKS
jgi:chaperone required for assembly of F1-ATPase